MSPKTKFFITGATGYIGGSVLEKFLNHRDAANFEFTALVRSSEKAEKFKSFGVNAVVGSLSDLQLLEKLASEADVVVATADCDDLPGAQATLRGLKKKFEATGKQPTFINTSGTGVLMVDSRGMSQTDEIYDDMNPEQIESLSPTAPHRPVDLAIVAGDKEGYVKTYIILPSTIYGIAQGKLVDAGLVNPHSQQVPGLIKTALDRGQVGMVGQGKNLWPHVHIDDVSDLYTVLYDAILSGSNPAAGHGREGFYFGANGEYKYYELCKVIGQTLVELGRAKSPEPTSFTDEELKKYFGGSAYFGSNSRCVANRSYAIGWSPKKTTSDFYGSVKAEVQAFIDKGL